MGGAKYDDWRTPEGLVLLEGWARDGLTEQQIAQKCGCYRGTLAEWKKRFPEIANALRKGRELVDYEIENAMLKRALGYAYTETRVESGEEEKVIQVEKHMPPNVSAQKFWLSRRKPEQWSDHAAKTDAKTETKDNEEPETGCVILPEVKDHE